MQHTVLLQLPIVVRARLTESDREAIEAARPSMRAPCNAIHVIRAHTPRAPTALRPLQRGR